MISEGTRQDLITAITSVRNCIDAIDIQDGATDDALTDCYQTLESAEACLHRIVTEADK